MKTASLRLLSLVVLCTTVLAGCVFPFGSQPEPTNTPTPTTAPVSQPSDTPPPPPTAVPTSAPPVDELPTPTPTIAPAVATTAPATFPPLPTAEPPLLLRIRNISTIDLNLYRRGRSGGWTFLGWVAPKHYGEYPWPDLGEWRIRYCERTLAGDSINCQDKTINVKHSGQEVTVP